MFHSLQSNMAQALYEAYGTELLQRGSDKIQPDLFKYLMKMKEKFEV